MRIEKRGLVIFYDKGEFIPRAFPPEAGSVTYSHGTGSVFK